MKSAAIFSRGRPLLAGGLALIAAAALAATVIVRRETLRRVAERTQVQLLVNEHAHALQRTIERAASATYTLAALVRQGGGTVPDFEGTAGRLLPYYPGAAALGLTRDGIVSAIAPRSANTGVPGRDLFKDPTPAEDALRARGDTGPLTLSGPYPLPEGGQGTVARLPVALEDASGRPVFRGFVFVVLRASDLLASAQIDQLAAAGLSYELARVGADGGAAEVIVASGPRTPVDAVSSDLMLPAGPWRLRAAPVAGWTDPWGLALKGALGGLFSALGGTLAYLIADLRRQRRGLVRRVAQRTADVRAREVALNRAQAVAQVGSWIVEVPADATVPPKIEWTRETFRIFGVPGDEPLGVREFMERIHPDDRARLGATWAAMPGRGGRLAGEFRIVVEQSVRWVRCQAEWEPGEVGRPPRWVGTVQEITAQRLAEEALRESELRYRALVQNAPAAIFVIRDHRVGFVNRACLELFGATQPEQLTGRQADELFHPEHRAAMRERVRPPGGREEAVPLSEARILRLDGTPVDVAVMAAGFTDQGVPAMHVVLRDITERKKVEDALRKSEESLAITLQSIGDAVIATDAGGGITRMNPTAERLTGWPRAEALGRPLGEVLRMINGRTRAPLPDPVARVLAHDAVVALADPTALIARDGTEYQIADTAAPMRDAQGRALGVVLVFSDVTEQFRVQEALRESEARARHGEERLELAVAATDLGLWDWDVASGALECNDRWCRMLGYERAELPPNLDAWDRMLHPEERAQVWAKLEAHLHGGAPGYESEHRLRHRAGHWVWILDRGKVMARDATGAPLRMNGTHMDITARKEAEAALRASLRETEALLKEVHHRVKNNLQVIASLLRLEAGRIGHPVTQAVLQDMQNRIRSMALLHETLYRSGSFAQVNLAAYLQGLCRHLFRSLGGAAAGPIELKLDVAPVSLAVDLAVPCGLIVSELASNCLKHGFPNGQGGEVRIALDTLADGAYLRLRVSDTGVGLPPDFAVRQERSLGLQLVGDLARQLRGHLEIGAGPAAVFEVTFPAGGADEPPGSANH